MVNSLFRWRQASSSRQGFSAARITGKAWVTAAGHLQTDAMPAAETVGGRPQVDMDVADAICIWDGAARFQANNPIA
jgi:hypothetical protein